MIFQKAATNFLFRLNRIARGKSHFFFCSESSHEIVHCGVDQIVILESILTRFEYLSVVVSTAFISVSNDESDTMKLIVTM